MSYRISAFDALELPHLRTLEQEHDMGTGAALTSFQQLPNGTFYDNYGSAKSPQGIRPLILQGWLVEETEAALRTALDALRKKLGVRGKLTVHFEDDRLRWQWARLVDVETPSRTAHLRSCPVELTFQTAAQHWYEIVNSPAEWTVGDGTWVLGDGTAELGENGTQVTLTATGATGTAPPAGGTTQAVAITHNGNIDATNLVFTITAGTTAISAVKIANGTTGENWYFSATVSAGNILQVDCGAMSITNNAVNAYANFTPSNRARWMTLDPGANTLTVTVNGNGAVNGTFAIEFYDHFA